MIGCANIIFLPFQIAKVMPQPIQRLPDFSIIEYGGPALAQRPTLAAHFGIIAALWTSVDDALGMLLARFLGIHSDIGIAMYLSLETAGPKKALLLSAAENMLDADQNTKLKAILSDYKGRAAQRNTVIHGLWGASDKYPDALILAPQSEFLRRWAKRHENEKTPPPATRYMLYKEKDFVDIEKQINRLYGSIYNFYGDPLDFFKEIR